MDVTTNDEWRILSQFTLTNCDIISPWMSNTNAIMVRQKSISVRNQSRLDSRVSQFS